MDQFQKRFLNKKYLGMTEYISDHFSKKYMYVNFQ